MERNATEATAEKPVAVSTAIRGRNTAMNFPEIPNGEWSVNLTGSHTTVLLSVTEDNVHLASGRIGTMVYTFSSVLHGGPTKDPEKILRAAAELVADLPRLRADVTGRNRDAAELSELLGVPVGGWGHG